MSTPNEKDPTATARVGEESAPDKRRDSSEPEGPKTIKVTMNLTQADRDNTEKIQRLTDGRSKADAVSTALSLTRFLLSQIAGNGNDILIRNNKDQSLEKIVMPEIETARQKSD